MFGPASAAVNAPGVEAEELWADREDSSRVAGGAARTGSPEGGPAGGRASAGQRRRIVVFDPQYDKFPERTLPDDAAHRTTYPSDPRPHQCA